METTHVCGVPHLDTPSHTQKDQQMGSTHKEPPFAHENMATSTPFCREA